jgi:hypothetical protein
MDQHTQYRVACFTATEETPLWDICFAAPLAVRAENAPVQGESADDQEQMDRFGISAKPKTVYWYKGYVRLADAMRYAHIDTARTADFRRE